MLSRAVLPLLRQRTTASSASASFPYLQARFYARGKPSDKYDQPLRKVQQSPGENIDPQPSERTTPISNPTDAPTPPPKGPERPTSAPRTSQNEAFRSDTKSSFSSNRPDDVNESTEQEPFRGPLPDLTKGIPSTLEAELNKAQAQTQTSAQSESVNITEDPDVQPGPSGGGQRGGELPRSAYISSSDRRKSAAAKYFYLGIIVGAVGYGLYLGRNWENEEEEKANPGAPNGWAPGLTYNRIRARLGTTVSYYSDPVTTKLLPDEDPDPNMRAPFVLVLSLEDMLVHSEWSRQAGWRIAKRPGVDYFLRYLSQYYELILFTSQPSFTADQILRKLDPFQIIHYPLFREHTLYQDGGHIKDLSYLNRDLKKIVIMDTDPHHVKNQPENAIVIPKWTGDPNDQTLIQFIPFLEYLASMGFDDARLVLKSMDGKYIPAEFARREKLLREKFEHQGADKRKRGSKGGFGFGSLFGAKQPSPDGMQSPSEASSEGKMIWDQIRERGQKNYEAFEKKIQEEGAKWLAEREAAEKQAQEEAMASMKTGMFGWFGNSAASGEKK